MGFFNWAAPVFGHFADRWSPTQIEEIVGWIEPFFPPAGASSARIVDVGGGTGALASRLSAALGTRVTVVDPTPEMMRYLPKDGSVEGVMGTAERIPFPSSTFDALIVTDAFHHFRDQPAAVREFARVVRCGGGIVVVELDPTGFIMRTIVLAEKILGEPGAFMTPQQMCAFMAEHGIDGECERTSGVNYRFTGAVRAHLES